MTQPERAAADAALNLGLDGSILRAGGDRLITLGDRGTLGLVRADGVGLTVISHARIFENARAHWSTPLIHGGRLYVRGESELHCYDISTPASPPPAARAGASRETSVQPPPRQASR